MKATTFRFLIPWLALVAVANAGQAATTTFRINASDRLADGCVRDFQAGNAEGCLPPSADGGLARYAFYCDPRPIYFDDPLPFGSVVTQVDLRVALVVSASLDNDRGSVYFGLNQHSDPPQEVERYLGNVTSPPNDMNIPNCPGYWPDRPPSGFVWVSLAGPSSPSGIPHYAGGMQNSIWFWAVPTGGDPSTYYSSRPHAYVEAIEITLHYEPPPTIEFDITDATASTDRKILISRTRTEPQYDYESQYQRRLPGTLNADRDGKIEISGTVRNGNGQPIPGKTIYLRLADPPDSAAYVVDRYVGDNHLWLGGALQNTSVTTDASGRFVTVLSGAPAAGDNYRVEATTIPHFRFTLECGPSNACHRSGELTMWKRVYVEKHRMLRNGLFLNANAQAGDTSIVVRGNRYGGNTGRDRLSRGDRIVLVHAPQLNRSDVAAGWYTEAHSILDVTDLDNGTFRIELGTRQGSTISREVLQKPFSVDQTQANIGDALTRVQRGSITAADVFDAADDLVLGTSMQPGTFRDAFVDYVYLQPPLTAGVPVPYLSSDAAVNQDLFQALADKWSATVLAQRTPPNHQLLVIAGHGGPGITGIRISNVQDETSSWVFRQTIEGLAHSRSAADLWAMKTCAHEIGHQWLPNESVWGPSGDHCPAETRTFDSASVYCLLAAATPTGAESQRTNGIARFHMLPHPTSPGTWHSEYFEIRRHADPFLP